MGKSSIEHDRRLTDILDRLCAIREELTKAGDEPGEGPTSETWYAFHRLKEEYRRLTGIYPNLPPFDRARSTEPGT